VPDGFDHAEATLVSDAGLAAAMCAVDPLGLGGVILRGFGGGARESWLELLQALLPNDVNFRRLPTHVTDDRLLGGLDLAATLAAGRPILERGVLADANGGFLLVPSAERLPASTAAMIVSAMDRGEVRIERDGLAERHATRFSVIALDEGLADEQTSAALRDRLAFHLSLNEIDHCEMVAKFSADRIAKARARLPDIALGEEAIDALCNVAAAFGIGSLNAPLLAVRATRCSAALHGRAIADEDDVATAARLVLAPRATMLPSDQQPQETPEPDPTQSQSEQEQQRPGVAEMQDMVLATAQAAIPPDLLARLLACKTSRTKGAAPKGAGFRQSTIRHGRPAGIRRGTLRSGARLNVLATLRAAAPWQCLRTRGQSERSFDDRRRIEVRSDDFRIRQRKDRRETVTMFVVDASGSTALQRLAEAKGAVELLLADCYVRRDHVALITFGGRGAELLLPPTRSLTRARRRLADLPGGGGTPFAEALEQTALLAQSIKRRHQTPAVVILTDGRPNLCRDGRQGREAAEADAIVAAGALRHNGVAVLLIDTSPRPEPSAARIAEAIGAQYVPLPQADAQSVSAEVRARFGS
jgi:magnesium chelatase subunit D